MEVDAFYTIQTFHPARFAMYAVPLDAWTARLRLRNSITGRTLLP